MVFVVRYNLGTVGLCTLTANGKECKFPYDDGQFAYSNMSTHLPSKYLGYVNGSNSRGDGLIAVSFGFRALILQSR